MLPFLKSPRNTELNLQGMKSLLACRFCTRLRQNIYNIKKVRVEPRKNNADKINPGYS